MLPILPRAAPNAPRARPRFWVGGKRGGGDVDRHGIHQKLDLVMNYEE